MILLQAHIFDRSVQRLHSALQRACAPDQTLYVLMHAPPGTPKPAVLDNIPNHFVTTPEIRSADFPGKSLGEPWSIWQGGHTDLIALHFARTHPHFDYYWVIEYDVRFTGRWQKLFDHFANNTADLLSTTIRSFEADPNWEWWNSATNPAGQRMPTAGMLCAFMPIFRFSKAALQEMERRYQEGWSGHTEVTWPTFLNEAGLVVEDLGGNGTYVRSTNRGRFYANSPLSTGLAPGSFVFRPARLSAGLRRNWLYHPIKPPAVFMREQWNYQTTRVQWKLDKIYSKSRKLFDRISGSDAV